MLRQGMDGLGQERGGALHLAPPSGRRGAGRDRPTTRLPVREQRLKVELVPGRGARPGQCRANLDFAAARDMGRGAKFAPRPPSGSRWYHTGRITRPRIGLPPRGHLGPPDDDLRCKASRADPKSRLHRDRVYRHAVDLHPAVRVRLIARAMPPAESGLRNFAAGVAMRCFDALQAVGKCRRGFACRKAGASSPPMSA
jgi:hypothetical protein